MPGSSAFSGTHSAADEPVAKAGSHGFRTPDACWKTTIRNNRVIAWIIDNDHNAISSQLNRYLMTVRELEQRTGEQIPMADYLKDERSATSWILPIGCDRCLMDVAP